jgi:hypothetical protein
MDHEIPIFRRDIDQELDLFAAVRLPGTIYHLTLTREQTSPTDLLVLRRRLDGEPNRSAFPGSTAAAASSQGARPPSTPTSRITPTTWSGGSNSSRTATAARQG